MSPAKNESQRKLFGAALSQKRGESPITNTPAGKIAETMSEKKIKDFVTKEDTNLELDKDKDNLQVGVQMQDTKQHEMLNKSKTKEFNDYVKKNTCKKEEEEKDKEENEGIQNCEMKKGGPGSGRKEGSKNENHIPMPSTSQFHSKHNFLAPDPNNKGKMTMHTEPAKQSFGSKVYEHFHPAKPKEYHFETPVSKSDTDFSIEFLEKKIKELDGSCELKKEHQQTPPWPGAVFDEQSHRWKREWRGVGSEGKAKATPYRHQHAFDPITGKDRRVYFGPGEEGGKFRYSEKEQQDIDKKRGTKSVKEYRKEMEQQYLNKSILDTPIQQAFNNYMNSFSGQESKDECIAFVNTSSPIVKITSTYDKTTDEVFPDNPGISDKNLQSGATKEGRENQPFDYSKTVYENPEAEKEKDEEEMELEKGGPGSGRKTGPGSEQGKDMYYYRDPFVNKRPRYPNGQPKIKTGIGSEGGMGYDYSNKMNKSEKLDAFNDYVQKEMPTPPRSGLVFNRQSHRWERPVVEENRPNHEFGFRELDAYAKKNKVNSEILRGTIEGINEGKTPEKAFRDAAEDENYYGSRPDIVADRKRNIEALEHFGVIVTRDILSEEDKRYNRF